MIAITCLILGTVLDELERSGKSTALTTLCIGAGMGTATIIERVGNRQFDIGMAAAQSIIMLAITIILARLYIRLFYREVR